MSSRLKNDGSSQYSTRESSLLIFLGKRRCRIPVDFNQLESIGICYSGRIIIIQELEIRMLNRHLDYLVYLVCFPRYKLPRFLPRNQNQVLKIFWPLGLSCNDLHIKIGVLQLYMNKQATNTFEGKIIKAT